MDTKNGKTGALKSTTYKKRRGRHEHRIVAEEMLGRKLFKNEIVHHVDGNRHNNDPSNLNIMTQSEHIHEHRTELKVARHAQGAAITHCPRGHDYTRENTYVYADGRRQCITCRKAAFHKWKAKKNAQIVSD